MGRNCTVYVNPFYAEYCVVGGAAGGSSGYAEAPLENPLNNTQDMNEVLELFGFEITRLQDTDRRCMEQATGQLSREPGKDTVGLFYFAGHGLQVGGENYLMQNVFIPVPANLLKHVYSKIGLGVVSAAMRLIGAW